MKRGLVTFVAALALTLAGAASAQAAGGGGFSIGLRLSGDASWYGWYACNPCPGGGCGSGGGAPAGPSMWPMGGPNMGGPMMGAPMAGGPAMGFDGGNAMAQGYPMYNAPMYGAPMQGGQMAQPQQMLAAPAPAVQTGVAPAGYFRPASYSNGSSGFIFPANAPSYWR